MTISIILAGGLDAWSARFVVYDVEFVLEMLA